MIRAVVVDDEPLARERLRSLVAAEPDIELVAECSDGAAAVDGLERHQPDLVFLDIQLPELDGFQVLESLGASAPAVVFVTAYDAFAIRAFEVAAVDYLLKPIDPTRFRVAVERARTKIAAVADPVRFVVRTGTRVSFVPAIDVEWIEATGNYARLGVASRTHLVRETMTSIEARLDPARFVRIHRSVIVQVGCIEVMEPYFHGEWVVTMRSGRRFTSSRTHSERVRALRR